MDELKQIESIFSKNQLNNLKSCNYIKYQTTRSRIYHKKRKKL